MKIVIVGGGKVGFYLAKTLLENGHDPFIIEVDRDRCAMISNQLDIPVFCGDGSSVDLLQNSLFDDISAFAAVTGLDEVNLVACQLGKKLFRSCKTVARVNDPKNVSVMYKLGVDIPISTTDNISRLLEREIDSSRVKHLMSLGRGEASINQLVIPDTYQWGSVPIQELGLPEEAIIVSVTRQGEFFIPNGNTRLHRQDEIILISRDSAVHQMCTIFALV